MTEQEKVATWKPVLLAFIALPIGFCVFTQKRALYLYCLTKLIMYSFALASCVIMIIAINIIRNRMYENEDGLIMNEISDRRRLAERMPIYAAIYTCTYALFFAFYLWMMIVYRKKARLESKAQLQ